MKVKIKVKMKMRIGTHRCRRCCRGLLLPSLLRSPLPSPFLVLPLLVDFCPSHHCHGFVATISSTAALVDCCLCPLCSPPLSSSSPVIVIIATAASRNRSRPCMSRPPRKDVWRLPPATAQGSRPRRQYRWKPFSDSGPLPPTPASTRRCLGAPPLPTLTLRRR